MTNHIQIVQPGRRLAACLTAAVLCLLALAGVARAANSYTVDSQTDAALAVPGSTSCQSTEVTVADPLGTCTLRAAVQAADNAGGTSTITVPAGGYPLTIAGTTADDPSNGDLDVTGTASITIIGAGAGTTTIDANAARDRAFAIDSAAALELDSVTVRGGAPAATSSGYPSGGAVYSDGSFTAHGDVFTDNTAATSGSGGAIEQAGAGALLVGTTTFTANMASTGGAIDDTGTGTLTITGDTFGHPTGIGSGDSGSGNTAQANGGAIADESSANATISASTFSANQTAGSGGGLSLSGSSYILSDDEFDANTAAANAGAIRWTHGTLIGRDDTFAANSASSVGGAIDVTALQPLSLTNTTFWNNAAASGGALAFGAATPLELVNDTLWENFAGTANAGNAISGAARVIMTGAGVQNTAIGTPNGSGISGPSCDTALPPSVDEGHNLGTDASCLSSGSDLTNPALVLSVPANNGGDVATEAEPAGAPTIDAGTNTVCPGLDARGVSRPQGAACDIGAYEFIPPPVATTSTTATVTDTSTATATTTVTTSSAPTTTAPPAPGVVTRGAMAILTTSAFLGGTVDPHGQATTYSFQIGTTNSYGTASVSGHTDTGPLTVETRIAGLKPNTLYHYRMVATSGGGTGYGADRTFRTLPSYNGSLVLRSTRLKVHAGAVAVRLACQSSTPCTLRLAITVPVRLTRTHKVGTLSFTRTTNPLVRIRAHDTVTVRQPVTPAGLSLLGKAAGHRLPGTLSTRPRSAQRGLITPVVLALT